MTEDNPDQPPRPLWQRLMGVRRRKGKRLRFVPTMWGWILIVGIVLGGGMVGFAEYSMQPDFCRSCHLMEPYYQAWHESTHQGIPCADCHFEPGWRNTLKGKWEASSQAAKYITNTYGSKPHAEIRDVSCLRSGCHEQRLLEGDVEWTVTSQTGVPVTIKFDHAPHLNELRRGKKLRCVSCHSQMVQGKHIVVTLDTCFLCHFKGFEHGRDDHTLGGCDSCHAAPKETIRLEIGDFSHAQYIDRGVSCNNCHSDTLAGDGSVPRQFCWTCHNDPDHLARYGDTKFMHDKHVTETKVECSSCHVQIVHHLTAGLPEGKLSRVNSSHALANPGGCGECHESLHDGAMLLYRGTGGRGVDSMPSAMFRAQVDCIGCHQSPANSGPVKQFVGQSFRTRQPACDHCHGTQYDERLEQWKSQMATRLEQSEQVVERASTAMSLANDLDATQRLELQRLLDDAKHNVDLVRFGRGVHNVTYANALLSVAAQNAQRILDRLGDPEQARHEP